VRTASHAGNAYPAEPGELGAYLDSFFLEKKSSRSNEKEVFALISPHIDLKAGKKVYARAYQEIENFTPQRIIVLGTGHSIQEPLLSLTEKDFETPLGLVKTDKDWVRKLKEVGKGIICNSDIAHRSEHSIEFQLIFLQHLFGSDFFLLPILCGSFHKVLEEASRPSEIPGMDTFFTALRLTMTEYAADTLLIAGVDFSHIGPKFGHRQSASSMLLETKNHDKLLIDAICKGDVESFWSESRKVKGIYNVCGFSAIACLLEVLSGVRGHLLDYDIWQEESRLSAVSFAAIAFKRDQQETIKE
jgi:AmmeMemoRadiSam system protein B